MKRFIQLLFIALLLTSCKDKGVHYIIDGTILDKSFNKSLADVKVQLLAKKSDSFTFSKIDETQSDSEGKFIFKFPRERVIEYKIVIDKEQYFNEEYTILPSDLKVNQTFLREFPIYAFSWVKIHLKNTGNVDSFDDFIYKKLDGKEDCEDCCPSEEEKHYTGANDVTFYCMTEGGKKFSYYYELKNTGFLGNKEIITIPLDTVLLETEY